MSRRGCKSVFLYSYFCQIENKIDYFCLVIKERLSDDGLEFYIKYRWEDDF
jgi:hypothetical protein